MVPIGRDCSFGKSIGGHNDSETTFEFIEDCYEMPVAVWPHDPLGKLGSTNPARKYSEIIDRNRDEDE